MRRLFFAILISLLPLKAFADEPAKKWFTTVDLQYLSTSGNSENTTFGAKLLLVRKWENQSLSFSFYGQRQDSGTRTLSAYLDEDGDIQVTETKSSAVTAENYKLENHYNRTINEKFSWIAGYDLTRNQFAGLDLRHEVGAGLSRKIRTDKVFTLETGLSGVWVREVPTLSEYEEAQTFGAIQLHWNWKWQINPTVALTQKSQVIDKLEHMSDWRVDMDTVLETQLSKRMSGKLTAKWLFDNEPALIAVTVLDSDNQSVGQTPVPSDKTDIAISLALSLKF